MNATATSIRYQQAQVRVAQERLTRCPEQQAEAIAKHYVAHAVIARQIMELLWCSKAMGPNADTDYAISTLVNTIKENHSKDLGIELEWSEDEFRPE